ncbi:HNH endonuclease [Vibrio sp. T3Y01]|uniref:HNH endonuclease n=1 Tax=Vibrio sp. T3Y01 TaxID=2607606 RepID=UPI0020A57D35|nr:HNH endonuclease [Vibrio sp. T3Y01]
MQYVKWLDDVNTCFNMDVVSDIYNLSVRVYVDFILYIRSRLPEEHAENCIRSLKLYSRFIDKIILVEEIYPEQSVGGYFEGALQTVKVNRFERNQKARDVCISHHGASCKVCDINFVQTYGNLGAGFIHVHHIVPISEICNEYEIDPVNDLVPVCPNCHAMLHRKTPPLTVEQLREITRKL